MVCYGIHMVTNTVTEQIAERVAAAIARSGRKRNWVALKSGIPLTTFSRKVNGHVDFTVPEIVRIALVLDVKPSALLPRELTASEAA